MKRSAVRVLALILLLSNIFSPVAYADFFPNTPRNSAYIDYYVAGINSPSYGQAQVWFSVGANVVSDVIGTLTILLQESDDCETATTVKTFSYINYPNMIKMDANFITSSVIGSVEHGHYYKARLTFYVANNGEYDSRIYETNWIYI